MDIIGIPLLQVLSSFIHLYTWVVLIHIVFEWISLFGLVNMHNRFVALFGDVLRRLTEPVLDIFRRFVPNLGGLDLSPMILLFALYFLENVLSRLIFKMSFSYL